jgi:hypothetical protein
MPQDDDNDDLDAAARMIGKAFQDQPLTGHPLSFVREGPFLALVAELDAVIEKHDPHPQVILCALTEMLMRSTSYKISDPNTGILAARAAPIIRQLVCELKGASEILVIISAMITNIACHADRS